MKVIFLDFDGVINNFNHFDGVDYENVKWLLEIVKLTDAKIVATTSNKYSFQREKNVIYENTLYYKYVVMLKEMGIDIYDITPYIYGDKKLEINEYLKQHRDINQFVIIDDEFISEQFKDHQVILELYNGLCGEHVEPAVNILNGSLGYYPKNFDFSKSFQERWIIAHEYHKSKVRGVYEKR